MLVKLGKSFKGNHAQAGQVVDLPDAIAKAGLKSGLYVSAETKKAPAKKKSTRAKK